MSWIEPENGSKLNRYWLRANLFYDKVIKYLFSYIENASALAIWFVVAILLILFWIAFVSGFKVGFKLIKQ